MATPRRPLQVISGNSTIKKELSPYQRGIIVGATQAGANITKIQRHFLPQNRLFRTLLNSTHNATMGPRDSIRQAILLFCS